jgi:DNA-nicking Smr family endonuclease
MPRKTDRAGGSKTQLSPDERALWQDVTDSVEPLEEHERSGKQPLAPDPAVPAMPPALPRLAKKKTIVAPDNSRRKAQPKVLPLVAPAVIDRRARRKIARGQTAIDSTLDLHGMTQEQAFSRLHRHIEQASAAGQRCILVITGKGGQGSDAGSGKGVLRRNLPDWLANQALGGRVSGITAAAPSHGGSGAFYVRLKRQK